uniref:Major facilitator superfamily (MFS) profile domain-containing protein n=1 Tax=Chromera velia CCMP2878 TaxID=1169474 RepID=A0A0G4HHF8_9ALVE|eukprot:Cvel_27658.t1-p1 / transcript=Cvel_27658.t1 / gene=Cvel_27658 / organism=Chromera_velia_CCMP2878 / gene_product=hypothetical protein / transcript_product=hypothetical protein / location=Cvel_scaffold3485:4588-4977(+) / protein_length=130 / sequence_SO=supercontig / SO=protein_coding / is_pseudo=false
MSVTGPAREKTSAPEAELALSQIPTDAESQVKEEGDPPGRWRALVLLGFSVLCGLSTWYSANTVIPDLEREWGLSGGLSVWLSAVVPVGFVIGALCSAWWSVVDRVGGRRFIALGCLASAVCNGLMACGV